MKKIKTVAIWILGALSTFFYALSKSKERQAERFKDEADRYRRAAELQGYIAKEEREAKYLKDRINSASESDIDSMLEQHKAFRD